jgi:hypothetical protein
MVWRVTDRDTPNNQGDTIMRKFFVAMFFACALIGFAGLATAQDVYVETDGDTMAVTDGDTAVVSDGDTHVITDGDTTVIMDNDGNAVVLEE